jgi:hypothetical protein
VRSGALRINEPRGGSQRRAASPPRSFLQRLVKAKKEPKQEPEQEVEWPGLKEATEASFNTIQPATEEFAADWSLRSFTAAELERQRQALAELERQRQARVELERRRSRIPPPPVAKEIPYFVLDLSDSDEEDDGFRQALLLSRFQRGDGEGPSSPPGDGSGDDDDGDDGGDYSKAIQASLGIN